MKLGRTIQYVRNAKGMTHRVAAKALSISEEHLWGCERDAIDPSARLLDRMRSLWGVDIYALAWCLNGDLRGVPEALHGPIRDIGRAYLASVREDANEEARQ